MSLWSDLVASIAPHLPSLQQAHTFGRTLEKNIDSGVNNVVQGGIHAVAHPIDSAINVIKAAPGAVKNAVHSVNDFATGAGAEAEHALGLPSENDPTGLPADQQEAARQDFLRTAQNYKKNYGALVGQGSWSDFANHLADHPWQTAADIGGVVAPVAGAVGKLAKFAKAGEVADTADLDQAFGHAPEGHGGSTGGPVRPMDPQMIGKIMGNPTPSIDEVDQAFGHAPAPAPTGDNVVPFPQRRMNNRDVPTTEDVAKLPPANQEYLRNQTAAEAQDYDASVPTTPVDNTGYEKHTPYVETPPAPANSNAVVAPVANVPDSAYEALDDLLDKGRITGDEYDRRVRELDRQGMSVPERENMNKLHPDENVTPIRGNGSPNLLDDESGKFKPWGKEYEDDENPEGSFAPALTSSTQKLAQAIIDAEKPRGQQDAMVSRAKSQRFDQYGQNLNMAQTEDDFLRAKSAMAGELPKALYPSIRDQFTPEERTAFHQAIASNPRLPLGAKLTAQNGLEKLLGPEGQAYGAVPTPSELRVLAQVFPKEVIDALQEKSGIDWEEVASNIAGIPMALMTTGDVSSPFRHAAFFATRPEFWQALPKMAGDIASPGYFRRSMDEIAAMPRYEQMQKAGVDFTDVSRDTPLANHEEGFQSNYVKAIPGLGGIVKASERGYTGFLNRVRAEVFNNMYDKLEESGVDFKNDPKALYDLGKLINVGTGRGNLGNLGPLVANTAFAPKLLGAKLTQLNPKFYYDLHPAVRAEALKSLGGYIGVVGSAMALAKLSGHTGAAVWNPLDPDFGKWKDGNVRVDLTGGNGTIIKMYAKVAKFLYDEGDDAITGAETGTPGNKSTTALTDIARFARSKAGPVSSMAMDVLDGKTYNGTKVSESDPLVKEIFGKDVPFSAEIMDHFTPMVMSDMRKVYAEQGKAGLAKYFMPDMLGAQTSVYQTREPSSRGSFNVDDIDKAFGHVSSSGVDDIDKAFGHY